MAVDLEIISIHIHRIKNRWSAVCCPLFGFKVQEEFPSEQLGFALLRAFRFHGFCSSVFDLQIKVLFDGRFQGEAGPPQVDVSKH